MNDLISRQEAIALADGLKDELPDDERAAYCVMAHNEGILEYQTALSLLPSAQPDLNEWCYDCKEYDKEQYCCHRWTKVIRETVEEIKREQQGQQWIPCSERLPEEEGWYLVTIQNDKTRKRRTENDLFAIGIAEAHKHTPYKFCKDGHRQTVIAWMSIPEPYKAESEEV